MKSTPKVKSKSKSNPNTAAFFALRGQVEKLQHRVELLTSAQNRDSSLLNKLHHQVNNTPGTQVLQDTSAITLTAAEVALAQRIGREVAEQLYKLQRTMPPWNRPGW